MTVRVHIPRPIPGHPGASHVISLTAKRRPWWKIKRVEWSRMEEARTLRQHDLSAALSTAIAAVYELLNSPMRCQKIPSLQQFLEKHEIEVFSAPQYPISGGTCVFGFALLIMMALCGQQQTRSDIIAYGLVDLQDENRICAIPDEELLLGLELVQQWYTGVKKQTPITFVMPLYMTERGDLDEVLKSKFSILNASGIRMEPIATLAEGLHRISSIAFAGEQVHFSTPYFRRLVHSFRGQVPIIV